MPFYLYILRSTTNELYIGQTNNLEEREKQHTTKDSKSVRFIKEGTDFQLVYHEEHSSRLEAMRREAQLKNWSRAKKEALIKGDLDKLKKLSKSNA